MKNLLNSCFETKVFKDSYFSTNLKFILTIVGMIKNI